MPNARIKRRGKIIIKRGLISIKSNLARAALFLYISLPLLLHDWNLKLSSFTFYGGNVCFHIEKLLFVFGCLISFPLQLILTLLAAKISHFVTTTLNF